MTVVAHDVGAAGGMERVHAELIRRLALRWEVTVVSSSLDPELRESVTWKRVPGPSRPFPLKFALFFLLAGLRLRREGGVVHTCGAIVPNRVQIASVHLCHAGVLDATAAIAPPTAPLPRRLNSGLSRVLALAAERWCYRPGRLQVLHAVSAGVAEELGRHYPGVEVAVIPNGVDARRFAPDAGARRRTRAERSVPDGAVVALFVGGDWDRKGLAVAIEGVAGARRAGADIVLWVVGPGDRQRFERQAHLAGLTGAVEFLGRQEDAAPFYQGADVLVLPSRYEAYPLVSLEAAAAGLPVVATAVSGVVDLVGDDQAGMILGDDPAEWGGALHALAADPGRRRALGEEARRRALEMDWDTVAARFEALAERVRVESHGRSL